MSWPIQTTPKSQRPHSNEDHRACPTTPKSLNKLPSSYQQNPVQQNVIESTSIPDKHIQPLHYSQPSIHSTTTMPPAPSDPEGSIPIERAEGIGGSSSVDRISTDTKTTSRSSLPGYRGSISTPTSSHTSTSETSMLSSSDISPEKTSLPSDHGGARQKTHPQTVVSALQEQPQPTSSHLGILSTHLQTASHPYTTSSGGAVLQTLRDPSHYEELSVIGNGK